jgi:L-ascorbate metabolism protein UlaG (beta-lactamase superfamily)
MGDVGNPLDEEQLEFLSGTDLLFALAGGHPTIELDDLEQVIEKIHPKLVIPMHFRVPGPEFFMLPVDEFAGRFPENQVTRVGSASLFINATELKTLAPTPQIRILEAQNIKAPPRTV